MPRVSLSDARNAMDYLLGTPIDAIAVRDNVTPARVYQRLNRVAQQITPYHSISAVLVHGDLSQFSTRLHDCVYEHLRPADADSPEGFYFALFREAKRSPCPES